MKTMKKEQIIVTPHMTLIAPIPKFVEAEPSAAPDRISVECRTCVWLSTKYVAINIISLRIGTWKSFQC